MGVLLSKILCFINFNFYFLCCITCICNLGFPAPGLVVQEEVTDELLAGVVVHQLQDELLKEESNEEASTCWLSPSQGAEILQWDSVLDEVEKDARCESQTIFKKGDLAPVDLGHPEKAARGTRTGPNLPVKSTLSQQGQMAYYAMRQKKQQVWQKGSVEAVLPGREGRGSRGLDLNGDGSKKHVVAVEGGNAVLKRKKKRTVVSRRPNKNTVGENPKLEVYPS